MNPRDRCLPTDPWDAAFMAPQPPPDPKDPFSLPSEATAYGIWEAREVPLGWSELVVSLAVLPSVDRDSRERGAQS